MCGISGLLIREKSFYNTVNAKDIISKMVGCQDHRGPDHQQIFEDKPVHLGHNRLSIIDLSENANQPFTCPDGRYTIVFNGEIYNYREIKEELTEYPFLTACDTEVLLAAFIKWREKCVDHFNGMFAFAIWDKEKNEIFIARDRLGIKPLYYVLDNEKLLFASEIRSIISSGLIDKNFSAFGVEEYLQFQTVFPPNTILDEVKMLKPGHWMKVDGNAQVQQCYWSLSANSLLDIQSGSLSYDELLLNIKETLLSSIEYRMIADVPLGAFLSGGIDSSLLVALMSEISNEPVHTFSIGFKEAEFDESAYAANVAKKYHTHHQEIIIDPNEIVEKIPTILGSMDHPSVDGPNTYLISEAVKNKGITVAISGLGGDELFAGYKRFKYIYQAHRYRAALAPVLFLLQPFSNYLKGGLLKKYQKVARGLDLSDLYFSSRELHRTKEIESLLRKVSGSRHLPKFQFNTINQFIKKNRKISAISNLDIATYMQPVLLRDTDQMSMAHALEVRVPFLDHRLVELIMQVEDKFKYPTTPKKLLMDALGSYLPEENVNRQKMGFTFPWEYWLKNELKDFTKNGLDYLKNTNAFNEEAIDNEWSAFQSNQSIGWAKIWSLAVLGHWSNKNLN